MSRVLSGNENLSIKTFIKLTRSLDLIFDIDIQAAMPDFAHEPICAGGQDIVNWGLLEDLVPQKHGSPLFKLSKSETAMNEFIYESEAWIKHKDTLAKVTHSCHPLEFKKNRT